MQARAARLDSLGSSLAKKRREAIEYRKQTGIEIEWDEDEDAYEGIDEASAAERNSRRTRPPGQIMPRVEGEVRSTVVLNITKPYCNAFASKIIDMRLQINDRAWAFKPTPVPEIRSQEKNKNAVTQNGQPVTVNEDGQPRQATVADVAKMHMDTARAAAEKAQKRVDDWLTQSKWDSQARQAIDDMARIGTGVLKGPFPEKCVYVMFKDGAMVRQEVIEPRSKRIGARNLFPDPACGENIHDGDYIWECDNLTAKRLKDLKDLRDAKGNPIYIAEQIDAVLEEGPRSPDVEYDASRPTDPAQKSKPFQIWYMTGNLDKDDLEAAGCACETENDTESAIVAMVNDHVIRASRNPLDNGKFPYDVAPCSRREGYWAGIGIARDLRTPQRMITGAERALAENAGLSAKPILAIMQGLLTPADGNTSLYGGKIFVIPKGTDINEAKNAIFSFQIESRQVELLGIIQFHLKMAEDVTGLPSILQGQQGAAPDVLGVVQILDANATSVARRVAKMFDDNMLEPHIGRYYDWLMQYGEDDSEKGDYTIDVLTPPDMAGDKAAIKEMGQLAGNPASRVDFAKFFAEIAKSNRFDPERIQYSDEEWAKMQKQQGPADPRIQVAQINNEHEAKLTKMEQDFEQAQNEADRQNKLVIAAIDERMNSTQLTSDERTNLEKIKATLAGTAMKLNVQQNLSRDGIAHQKDIAVSDHAIDMHKHRNPQVITPAAEPAGRAKPGEAFVH